MKTIVILGMHRSATSLIARTLHKEVHMGEDLLLGRPDNPKGHYENKRFLHLNIEILKAAGGKWNNPPTKEKILSLKSKFDDRIRALIVQEENIARAAGYQSWGFKDPRTVLTIDLYLPHLSNPQFICAYRDPMEIAKSLNKRDGIPIQKGINLAKIYNNRINAFMSTWLKNKYVNV